MAETIAQQVLAALAARLEAILPINGYNTDAGDRVYLARRHLVAGEDTLPALCLYLASERLESPRHTERLTVEADIVVEGHIDDPAAPLSVADALQQLAGDIKQALFPPENEYRYIAEGGEPLVTEFWPSAIEYDPPDIGGQTASLRFTARASWPETLGDPYTIL